MQKSNRKAPRVDKTRHTHDVRTAFFFSGAVFFASITIILACGVFYLGHLGVNALNGEYDKKTTIYRSEEYVAGSEEFVSDRAAMALEDALREADQDVLKAFEDDGGQILLTSRDISNEVRSYEDQGDATQFIDRNGNRSTVGYIAYSQKDDGRYADLKIVLSDQISSINKTLNHELGHYIDSKLGYVSMNDREFDVLYREYFDSFNLDYYFDDKSEFFAEVYALYRTRPDYIKKRCLPLYNLLEDSEAEVISK